MERCKTTDKEIIVKRLEGAKRLSPKEIDEELSFQDMAGVNTLLQELVIISERLEPNKYHVYRLKNGEIEVLKDD